MKVHDIENDVRIGVVRSIEDGMVYIDCGEDWQLSGTDIGTFDSLEGVNPPVVGDHVVVIFTKETGYTARVFKPQ